MPAEEAVDGHYGNQGGFSRCHGHLMTGSCSDDGLCLLLLMMPMPCVDLPIRHPWCPWSPAGTTTCGRRCCTRAAAQRRGAAEPSWRCTSGRLPRTAAGCVTSVLPGFPAALLLPTRRTSPAKARYGDGALPRPNCVIQGQDPLFSVAAATLLWQAIAGDAVLPTL